MTTKGTTPLRWQDLLPAAGEPVGFETIERVSELAHLRIHVDETVPAGTMFLIDSRVLDPKNPGFPTLRVNGQDLRYTVAKIQGLRK